MCRSWEIKLTLLDKVHNDRELTLLDEVHSDLELTLLDKVHSDLELILLDKVHSDPEFNQKLHQFSKLGRLWRTP